MASFAVIGAGKYGAPVAFNTASAPVSYSAPALQQSLRGVSTAAVPASSGLPTAACAMTGIVVVARAAQIKRRSNKQSKRRANKRGVQARAAAPDAEDLAFQPGEHVTLTGPPAMAGKQGTVIGPAAGDAFAVQFETGSIFNIAVANMSGPSTTPSTSASAASDSALLLERCWEASCDEEELLFQPGQRVTLNGPPAMAGKQGTVVGPALDDAFAIQFDTGSIFNIATCNIEGSGTATPPAATTAAVAASAPAATSAPAFYIGDDEEELLFQPGQRVTLNGPPAMAGKQGTVVGPALGDAFAIQFDTGSIFNIATCNIEGSGVAAPPAVAAAAAVAAPPAAATTSTAPAATSSSAPAAGDDEELLFQPGQRVTLNGPPAMAGKQGTVVGPALDDAFAIQFDTGSIFNIDVHNIEGSGISAPPAVAAKPSSAQVATETQATSLAGAWASTATSSDENLEFQPGEKVQIMSPPAMAGKRGEIVSPALGNGFKVMLESGSIFNIETANIQALATAMA